MCMDEKGSELCRMRKEIAKKGNRKHEKTNRDWSMQWFSTFSHQVPPQKIPISPSTTIITDVKIQLRRPTTPSYSAMQLFINTRDILKPII